MFSETQCSKNPLKIDEVTDVATVASLLKLSKPMIYRLISDGELPCIQFGRAIRLQREDIYAFIQNQRRVGGGKR